MKKNWWKRPRTVFLAQGLQIYVHSKDSGSCKHFQQCCRSGSEYGSGGAVFISPPGSGSGSLLFFKGLKKIQKKAQHLFIFNDILDYQFDNILRRWLQKCPVSRWDLDPDPDTYFRITDPRTRIRKKINTDPQQWFSGLKSPLQSILRGLLENFWPTYEVISELNTVTQKLGVSYSKILKIISAQTKSMIKFHIPSKKYPSSDTIPLRLWTLIECGWLTDLIGPERWRI